MDNTFLEELATHLHEQHPDDLGNLCVVFPAKRACRHFKHQLGQNINHPFWLPEVLAIQDFISNLSGYSILDTLSASLEVFPIIKKTFPDEPAEYIFSTATNLLKDFDEIDNYLVNTDDLFSNLFELKKLDNSINSWMVEEEKASEFQQKYLDFWSKLGPLYTQIQTHLSEHKQAYTGMATRHTAEKLQQAIPKIPWKKVIFAGFNALTPAEEAIMVALKQWELAEVYWDMDFFYTQNPQHEAGLFFREIQARWKEEKPTWVQPHFKTKNKKITVSPVPGKAGQAKAAGILLKEMLLDTDKQESIAVVLADENLLFPVLHSLPEELAEFNVTMGFPIRSSPLHGLVEALFALYQGANRLQRKDNTLSTYFFKDLLAVLEHPIVQSIDTEPAQSLAQQIHQENQIYIPADFFKDYSTEHIFHLLFVHEKGFNPDIDFILSLFEAIKSHQLAQEEGVVSQLDREFLEQYLVLIQKLKNKLAVFEGKLTFKMFRKLFQDTVRQYKIPFSGEPLKGVQIMGMLETRALDFEKVILLSANEDVLPGSGANNSILPYGIRRAFNLPVQHQKDAIFAYHFYRLLQRSKDIHLLYNSDTTQSSKGEESRFLVQIEHELAHAPEYSHITLLKKPYEFQINETEIPAVRIPKTPEIIDKIIAFGTETGFSPTAISQYLECSLKFYFRNILGLSERKEAEEKLGADIFGTITHDTLQKLYQPHEKEIISDGIIDELIKKIKVTVEQVFSDQVRKVVSRQGKNFLLKQVIQELVKKVLLKDKEITPFKMDSLEQRFSSGIMVHEHPIIIKGFADRIDEVEGVNRIIDYKTGNVERIQYPKLGDELTKQKSWKEALQLLIYAWLYFQKNGDQKSVLPGIISLRRLESGVLSFDSKERPGGQVNMKDVTELNSFLHTLLEEIMDEKIPFIQTEELKTCGYCSYKTICSR